jgi:hypothetical protein
MGITENKKKLRRRRRMRG